MKNLNKTDITKYKIFTTEYERRPDNAAILLENLANSKELQKYNIIKMDILVSFKYNRSYIDNGINIYNEYYGVIYATEK